MKKKEKKQYLPHLEPLKMHSKPSYVGRHYPFQLRSRFYGVALFPSSTKYKKTTRSAKQRRRKTLYNLRLDDGMVTTRKP